MQFSIILIVAFNLIHINLCKINIQNEVIDLVYDFKIEHGETVITIPLSLPKGVKEFKPDLKLMYKSNNGFNKELGFAWQLNGVSEISRCTKSFAVDSRYEAVYFNKSDALCLDGDRLMLVKGNYGSMNSEYRSEIDRYKKIVAFEEQGFGPKYFKVFTKENQIMTFGYTEDSTLSPIEMGTNKSLPTISKWFISKIEDYVGNSINFKYSKEKGFCYLKNVVYSNRNITFVYENRVDVQKRFYKNYLDLEISKLLRNISINVNKVEVKTFELDYMLTTTSVAKINYLKEIKQCVGGLCSNPLVFDYDFTSEKALNDITTIEGICGASELCDLKQVADMNGDGINDIVAFGNDGVYVTINNGTHFLPAKRWSYDFGNPTIWNKDRHPRYILDINDDGLPDVAGYGEDGVYVALNANGFFKAIEKWNNNYGYNQQAQFVPNAKYFTDVNNDGLPDLMVFNASGINIGFNTGKSFNNVILTSTNFESSNGWASSLLTLLYDVDGDNIKDKFGFGYELFTAELYDKAYKVNLVYPFPLSLYKYNDGWRVNVHTRLLVDMNNDNLADIVGFAPDGKVYVALSQSGNVSNLTFNVSWISYFGETSSRIQSVSDMNADGLLDLIHFDKTGVIVGLNNGSGIEPPQKWTEFIKSFDTENRQVADMNGDLIPDVVGFYGNITRIAFNRNRRPKLVNFTDSLGNLKTIRYSTISIENIKTKNQLNFQKLDQYSPYGLNKDVVTSLLSEDGIGGYNKLNYEYGSYQCASLQGRSDCSFSWVKTTNTNSDMNFIDEYYLEYPLTGILKVKKAYYNEIKIYKKTYNFSITKDKLRKTYTSNLIFQKNEFFDLTGKFLKCVVTDFRYDQFGNVIMSIENSTDYKINISKITNYNVQNDINNWYIGELQSKSVAYVKQIASNNVESLHTTELYEYNNTNRLLIKKTVNPQEDTGLEESFVYDNFGNIIVNIQKDLGHSDVRKKYSYYDINGLNIIAIDNHLLHRKSYIYDQYDNLLSVNDSNGLVTTYTYDEFGHKISEKDEYGNIIRYFFTWDLSLPNSIYKITKLSQEKNEITIYDGLNRAIRKITTGFNGDPIYEDSIYNNLGMLVQKSLPYKVNKEIPRYVKYEYDAMLREIKKEELYKNGNSIETKYDGLKVIKSDQSGHFTINTKNILDQVVSVEDTLGSIAYYDYDLLGNLIKIIDPQGTTVKITYNLNKQKISQEDDVAGISVFKYNAFDELIYLKHMNNDPVFIERDSLGRISKRIEHEGTTLWVYDTAKYGIGKLAKITGPSGYVNEVKYDSHSNIAEQTYKYDNNFTYSVKYSYDKLGREVSQTYSSNTIYKCYNKYGFVYAMSLNDSQCYSYVWKANDYDALGNILSETHGNNILTSYSYNEVSQISSINSKYTKYSSKLRQLNYYYDSNQNLIKKSDFDVSGSTYTQVYSYDILNRLVSETNFEAKNNVNTVKSSSAWSYDSIGNILFYHDPIEKLYTYSDTKHQQAIKIGQESITYDDCGRVTDTSSYSLNWYSFSKVKTIKANNTITTFTYGPERELIMKKTQNSTSTTTVYYVGDIYEKWIVQNGSSTSTIDKYHFKDKNKVFATKIEVNNNQQSVLLYLHNDAFGSVETITDQTAKTILKYYYTPFGKSKVVYSNMTKAIANVMTLGFIGSKSIENGRLIFMDGRVFDTEFLRFLSPDPFIQDVYNIQNLNRYSYGLNNPFKYKDPSGYFFRKLFKFLFNPLVIISVIVGIATAGVVSTFLVPAVLTAVGVGASTVTGSIISGALVGLTSGFTSSLVMSNGNINDALQGALIGGISGGLSGAIGAGFQSAFGKSAIVEFGASTLSDGIINLAENKDFFDGFEISALSFVASRYYKSAVGYEVTYASGKEARAKGFKTPPIEGANNIGAQGGRLNPDGWFNEGGRISRMLNKVPGLNAVAGMHDSFQINLPNSLRDVLNVPGMPVAGAITYLSLYEKIKCPMCDE